MKHFFRNNVNAYEAFDEGLQFDYCTVSDMINVDAYPVILPPIYTLAPLPL